MNKQVIFDMTINTPSTHLCITDVFFFSRKDYYWYRSAHFLLFFSCPRYVFPMSFKMCLKHIMHFMIIRKKIHFPVITLKSQLIHFTLLLLGFLWGGGYFLLLRVFNFYLFAYFSFLAPFLPPRVCSLL